MSEHNTKDYPEHLNPFKKPSGIRNSFRQFKRTLRQSFKWSQEKKPEVHRREPPGAVNHNGHSRFESVALRNTDNVQRSQTLMLPRSRFNERVNQAKTLCPSTKPPSDPNEKAPANPFEDEISSEKTTEENEQNPFKEEQENIVPEEIKKEHPSKGTIRRHRRKKRAPLPPGLNNSGKGFLSVPDINNSKWSLNSYDTDCSVYTYGSETEDLNENDNFEPNKNELRDIQEMSVEIQKYYNTNIDFSEPKTEASSIHETDLTLKNDRDIVIHDVIENASENLQKEENVGENHIEENKGTDKSETNVNVEEFESTKKFEKQEISIDVQNIVVEQGCEIQNVQLLEKESNIEERKEVIEDENETVNEREEELVKLPDKFENNDENEDKIKGECNENKEESKEGAAEENKEIKIEATEENKEKKDETLEDKKEIVETVETVATDSQVLDYQNNNITVLNESQSHEINYCTTNGIYIASSSDNLNGNDQILFNERKSLYITGSRDELNSDLGKDVIQKNESPVPKVRKHKLTKNVLLGTSHDN